MGRKSPLIYTPPLFIGVYIRGQCSMKSYRGNHSSEMGSPISAYNVNISDQAMPAVMIAIA